MLQAQKKFWGKRPGFDIGDVIHFGVNIAFVMVLYIMVRSWNLAALAGLLVVLSKWRVLAVQPRFWLPNVKANLVDLIVGLSTVSLIFQASSESLAAFWAALFAIWLLFIKPKTSDFMVGLQAAWAQLLGITTVFLTVSLLEFSYVGILLIWLVAWSAARHYLGNYEEPHYKLLSLIWAFLIAQLAWLGFHWVSYYQIFTLNISNIGLITTVIAATLGVLYHSYHNDKLHKNIVVENLIFGSVILLVLLLTSSWTVKI